VRPYQEEFAAYAAQLNRQVDLGHFSLAELTMAELHEETAGLGDESVVLLQSVLKDSTGETFEIEQSMEMIRQHCSVPIYVVDSRWLGLGALGGRVIDGGYQGQAAALMAIRILDGEDPNNIPVLTESPNAYMFDYTQLRRFGISVSDLPEGSIVIHEPQSFYYQHKKQVWAVSGLIAGLVLMVLLLSVNILRRKRAERRLTESEQRLRAIFDNATDGILLADPETKQFSTGNKMICQMLGYDLDELKSLSIKDVHPEEHSAYVTEQFEKQARGEISLARDIPVKRKDGTVFYADVNSARVKLSGKNYLMGLFRDITERRQAEAALRESQELFDAFMSQLPATAFIKDENSRVKYVNSFMVAYLGADKWIDKTVLDYYPPEVAKGVLEHDRRVLAEGPSSREEWVPIKSGEIRCMNTYKFPIKQHGKPPLIGGMAIDITERTKAQEEIKAERKKLADIIDGMIDGVTIIDMSGKIITINSSTSQQHGYAAEEIIGKTPAQVFIDEADAPKFHDAMKRLIAGEEIRGQEYLAKRKDGTTFPASVNLSPLKDIKGKATAIIAVHRDITERKRAEQTLQQAHDELEARVKRRTAELARVNKRLRSLASELSLAEEHARRRMATDVHDHVSQKLAISKMKLESLAELVRSSKVAKDLQEISDLVGQTIKSTRNLTFELSPPVLYELGFEPALEWLTRQVRQQHGLSTEFTDDGQAKPLDDDVRILLFQAVRELLVNVVKHSTAKNVAVSARM
jgi:PAS domain S-box-containing protein